jgi:hypothetical protein
MLLLAAGGAADPTAVFLQYGVVGALCVLLGMFALAAYRRERDRADRLEAKVDAMNERITDRFEDVMRNATLAMTAANDYLRDIARDRRH